MATSQIKAASAISYATVAFNMIAGLLYTPWMVSCIGSNDYALYSLALSIINFFVMDFGLSDSVTRFLSKYYAEGNEGLVPVFLGVVYKAFFVLDLVVFVVLGLLFFNLDSLYANLGSESLEVFRGLFVVVGFYTLVSFPFTTLAGILRANERFVALYSSNLAERVLNVALIVVFLATGSGVYGLVLVNAFTSLLFVAIRYVLVRRLTDARVRFSVRNGRMLKEVFGFSIWVTISQICQRLIFSIMPSILAFVSTSWDVALFGLASSIEGYVYSIATALNGMFMPRVSRALAGHAGLSLQEMMSRYGRIQLSVVGLVIIGFIGLGDSFVECWMGEGYSMLWPCASLLILPQIIELPQLVAHTATIAANEVRSKAMVYIAMAATNCVLGMMFSAQFGAVGACLSICVSYFLRTFGLNVIYERRLGIDLGRFFSEAYSHWVIPAAITLIISLVISRWLPLMGWAGLLVKVGIVTGLYVGLLQFSFFNSYEKELFRSFVRRAKGKRCGN